jgi:hypothetical protein
MARILIQEPPTAAIVLHSLQGFGFQLALLHHLLRTVTGQRMRGVTRRNLLLKRKLKGISLTVVPFKVHSWSHCPIMQPTLEFGKTP